MQLPCWSRWIWPQRNAPAPRQLSARRGHPLWPGSRAYGLKAGDYAAVQLTEADKNQVAPRRPGSQDPEDAIENAAVIYPQYAARLVGQHWLDGSPTPRQ